MVPPLMPIGAPRSTPTPVVTRLSRPGSLPEQLVHGVDHQGPRPRLEDDVSHQDEEGYGQEDVVGDGAVETHGELVDPAPCRPRTAWRP